MSVREESGQWAAGGGQGAGSSGQGVVGRGRYELNRRDFLRGATAFALLSTANYPLPTAHYPLPTAYSQSADAWPQFRGNYNNTGVSPSQLPAELKLLWTYDAGDIIESSAAIAAGVVYVGTANPR